MYTPQEIRTDPYNDLCVAIIKRAVKDYRHALKNDKFDSQRELERFFLGQDFQLYCSLDGRDIMRRVKNEILKERKKKMKKLFDTSESYELLKDVRNDVDYELMNPIIVIAKLDLWDGKKVGYKYINSGSLSQCLYGQGYETEWFLERKNDLIALDHHHDGTNHYLYREMRPGLSDYQKAYFQQKIYDGVVTKKDICRYTTAIGKHFLDYMAS